MDEAAFEQLLRRAQRREADALETLYELYCRRVFGLLYRLTGSRDVAEDLLQATFLRVVRVLPDYEHSGRFEAWLFRIAANLVRDRARKRSRHQKAIEREFPRRADDQLSHAATPQPVQPDEELDRRESEQRLQVCLADLSEMEREIILLRHYSELSFREIAEMLDIPLGTALSRAHRALARMRRQLGDESGD